MMSQLEPFSDWAQLLDHVASGYSLYYHLDDRPVRVGASIRKDGKIRVTPHWSPWADSFTADRDHLPRFRRLVSRRTS